ncbi:MAG: hypothetical protein MJE66_09610, partial [Proteobacteria bacterium]|nr:hypothetical protein [Pseudomonadota bacterium]
PPPANLGVPGLSAPAERRAPIPEPVRRASPTAPTAEPRARAKDPGLRGVPLGSLAACVSDRREDELKQKVMAAVTTQKECVSEAGRYRFVETKNLNAFLMWIERSSSRRMADRCAELTLALNCLRRGGGRE